MADGLFSTGGQNAQIVKLQMELERQKRIQDAGAGMDPLVASVARATQGMRESIGGIAKGMSGLLGGGQVKLDPRLRAAVKRDKDYREIMTMLSGFSADGDISEQEAKMGYSELIKRGYIEEAQQFLQQAASMGTMRRAEAGLELERGAATRAEAGLELQRKTDTRAEAAAKLAQRRAQAESELGPLRKRALELGNLKLEKQIATMGTGEDTKYGEIGAAEKKAVTKYIKDNPEITKAFNLKFKDNVGSFGFGQPEEENIRSIVETMAKLRTQKAYKSKSTLELLRLILGSSEAPATKTGKGRTFREPPKIGEPRK